MKTVYIVVMDYTNAAVFQYQHEFMTGYSDADVITWLELNSLYNESTCYYMFSEEPIPMQFVEVNN